jgi:hypothetical protein
MNNYLKEFFLNEYVEEKRIERALLKLDISETIFKTYTGAQPTEKHKINHAFNNLKKWMENLEKEIFGEKEYDEIKMKQAKIEAKKTWGDLRKSKKGKKKVMF